MGIIGQSGYTKPLDTSARRTVYGGLPFALDKKFQIPSLAFLDLISILTSYEVLNYSEMDAATATAVAVAIAAQLYISPIPEVSTVKVLVTYFSLNTALLLYLLTSTSQIVSSLSRFTSLNFIFLSTATTLTFIRRLYFSPLSSFPGPKLAALSNFYKANAYRTGRGAKVLLELHEKYNSDIVRVGPNELSIRNVDAIEKIYKGKYPRGRAYNLNTQRNYEVHTPWRRIW
jgi:hypothetical protein